MRILRKEEVADRTGLSKTTIWRLERDGDFPPRRRLGSNSVGWVEAEIDEWLKNRPTATPASAGPDE